VKNKIILIVITFFLILSLTVYADDVLPDDEYELDMTFETSASQIEDLVLNSGSIIAIESGSGRVLFEKNQDKQILIASTTKIVTAMVAIEHGNLEDIVTVSNNAAYTGGSTINLRKGEQLKMIELLYGLMLKSGNDAAVAIAEHISGSEEEFLKLMNAKAQEMGAENTNFATVHGLDHEDHHSTARDMAIITARSLENSTFRKIVSTAETHITNRHLRNTNDLLFTYQGAIGVKTGYTGGAGRCLVAAAKRDGMEVVVVVLGATDRRARFADSRKLLDAAFEKYSLKTVLTEGQIITDIEIIKGQQTHVNLLSTGTVVLPMSEEEKATYEINIISDERIRAPVTEGQIVGKLNIVHNNETIETVELKIAGTVESKGFWDFLGDAFNAWREIIQ